MSEPPKKKTSKLTIVVGVIVGVIALLMCRYTGGGPTSPSTNLQTSQKDAEAFMSLARSLSIPAQVLVDAKADASFPDRLLITVGNAWHSQPYQMRLQMAQNLWQSWANVHSPKDLDKARISLRDLNGNEVGGSRAFAGSLIWVQEN